MPKLLDIVDQNNQRIGRGIVVAFSAIVQWVSVHHPHVFHLLLREDLFEDVHDERFDCRCMYRTPMVAVNATIAGDLVTAAVALAPPDVAPPLGQTKAVALLLDDRAIRQLLRGDKGDLFVKLRGDFVIDLNKRAVDAEFCRAQLPTGDRPTGSPLGIQGGTFESWFTLKQG
jgi:hypothetical protein